MGYGYYEHDGMERGYSVSDVCHSEGCNEKIDRGLAYLCYSCTKYFCGSHLLMAWKPNGDDLIKFDCFAGEGSQCCPTCADEAEAEALKDAEAGSGELTVVQEGLLSSSIK